MRSSLFLLLLGWILFRSQALGTAGAAEGPQPPGFQEAVSQSGAAAPYLQSVHERIHPRWDAFLQELVRADKRFQSPKLATVVLFGVTAQGRLSVVEQADRVMIGGFDDAPLDLLRDLGTLPPPPPELRSDDGLTYVRWRFQRERPGCEEFAVVDRRLPPGEAVLRLARDGRFTDALRRARESLRGLGAAEQRQVLLGLSRALAHAGAKAEDAAVRAQAAALLARLPEGEGALAKLLDDGQIAVQQAALQALALRPQLSTAVQAPLRRRLAQGSELPFDDQVRAATLLKRSGDARGLEVLRERLAAGQDPAQLARVLCQLGDGAEAVKLTQRLLGEGVTQRAGLLAARSLAAEGQAGALAATLLDHASDDAAAVEEQELALLALAALPARALPPASRALLLKRLRSPAVPLRVAALRGLKALDDRQKTHVYRVLELLKDPAPEVRAAAMPTLVQLGGERVKDELGWGVRDKDPRVRVALLQALREQPIPSAPLLQRRLCRDVKALGAQGAELCAAPAPRDRLLAARGRVPGSGAALQALGPAMLAEDLGKGAELSAPRLRAAAAWLTRLAAEEGVVLVSFPGDVLK